MLMVGQYCCCAIKDVRDTDCLSLQVIEDGILLKRDGYGQRLEPCKNHGDISLSRNA